jgi:hypothetical protein
MQASKKQREDALTTLKSFGLKSGETIYTKMVHVSKSGMYRVIDLYVMRDNEPLRISYSAGMLLEGYDTKHEGAKANGCGMDMGFHLVHNLGYALFPDGFECTGEHCPSNDHTNAYNSTTNKFNGTKYGNCLVCGKELKSKPKYFRDSHGYKYQVCSKECATKTWVHKSGGYAFNQRWL